MEPLPAPPSWIPEDDLLLKNAVEGGASLESLAKGAVRFSRRYSLAELRERWRSLLYDPVISAQAAAAMAKLEIAKSNGNGIREREASGDRGDRKRKAQSIRKKYYAMRKRFCSEVFDSLDMALHDEMKFENNAAVIGVGGSGKIDDNLDNKDVNMNMNNLPVNSLVGYGNYSGLEEGGVGSSHSMSDVPLWKTIEDVSAPAMPVQVSLENGSGGSKAKEMIPHGLKGKGGGGGGMMNDPVAAVLGDVERHISDSLLDLTSENELVFMDIAGKDETAADKQCYDNVDSLLLSSPCDIQGNDASDVHKSQKLNAETKLAVPSGSSAQLEVVANPLGSSHGDLNFVSDSGKEVQLSAAVQSSHPELGEGYELCRLNTEDPDVPCNEPDVPCDEIVNASTVVPHLVSLKSQSIVKEVGFPDSSISNQRRNEPGSTVVPRSVTLKSISIVKEVGYPDLYISNQRRNEAGGSLKKEDIPSHSFAASQTVRPGLVPNVSSSNSPVGVVLRTENPARNSISAVSRQSNNVSVNINPSHSRLVHATTMHASDGRMKQEVIDAPASVDVYAHPNTEEHMALPDSEAKSLYLNQEGGVAAADDDSDDNDIENEIPYFSDAEAMILEMDLSPTDQDTNASREVLRYQQEETKRTMMRLEQCAKSFMERTIGSRGALAVLYGRNMKQYIKKSEVILGRATDEFHVDIDLGREGRANKISRRQALIKMEANGSFIIKNLGKSSIFLNGKEVASGQLRGLSDNSLVEIRGLSFIFEVNDKGVKRFIENANERRER